ncbi:zinc finger protein 28-like [Galleria mellonella]|uniref:Zinc finger protein 28-like n=1 Tax=Galleria mellonella TaxID=7137 RepID=A0ABM3MIB0_GALME|nr:zinc finger protein 28-like [Galleria mellonella]
MLSPRDDDDDDSHLCIKCNATIIGLDNYVKHRKQRCQKKSTTSKSDIPSINPLEPTYSLGADVFFQSLELQSSVKKPTLARLTPPIPTSKVGIDTKSTLTEPSTSRDLPRMSPLESNLGGEDWIGGHSLRIGMNEDNQTKLINAVASISGSVKKDIPTSSYNIEGFNDFKGDEDFDESEDSEDEDEDEPHATGEKWKPPPNYTGGKWRPASPENEDWDMRDEQEHMGGKWKSFITNDRDDDYDAPPPGHTKGKWVPGAHEKTQIMQPTIQTKGTVQYWCGPCNRRLGSKAIYDKHLMSSLHMRKVLPERELEFSGHLESLKNMTEKRSIRSTRFLNRSVYIQSHAKKPRVSGKLNVKLQIKKRKRKSVFVHCCGCKSRVRQHLMGKHLISHYHFRKATDTQSSIYKQLILDNIDAIVHQSPFQCSPCKFYTNWLSNFMQHWFSEEHVQKMAQTEGRYWCSFCKYECETSEEMSEHMSSLEHSEVVAVINRSMPIIIRKKSVLRCETCNVEFRYNMEIKRHCQKTGHALAYTATDSYQELHKCKHCKVKFKSSLSLAAHLKTIHKQKAFFCLVCSKTFNSSEEAKHHRQTSEHRIRKKEILKEKGLITKDLTKKCPYCKDELFLKNILELKDHIRRVHPHIKRKCPKCGMSFILSQEVTRHIRNNACQFRNNSPPNSSILWNCSQCVFTTDSQAECFFHEVLHSDPVRDIRKVGNKEKVYEKYICPICHKTFKKASLREHLRIHTSERPFVCATCGANFTRLTSLVNHNKSQHKIDTTSNEITKPEKVIESADTKTQDWKCSKCPSSFPNRTALRRHASKCGSMGQKCPHDQCTYVSANLVRHRRAHGEQMKNHQCQLCTFKTNHSSHLKRHMLCHKGLKPYGCPHCQFVCGSLENLRKHAHRRHPGLPLYRCECCEFSTDMAALLRSHLTTVHSDKYDTSTAFNVVKLHLMTSEYKKDIGDE